MFRLDDEVELLHRAIAVHTRQTVADHHEVEAGKLGVQSIHSLLHIDYYI